MTSQLRQLHGARELLLLWTIREVRVRYKQSFLGTAWAILQPVSLALVFTFVFTRVIPVDTGDVPYIVFAYVALLPWTFHTSSITHAVPSLVSNVNLITKVNVRREVIPIATTLSGLVDFGVGAIVLAALLLVFNIELTWTVLWIIPLLMIQFAVTLGVVLLGASLNVLYRDVRFIIPLATQIWLYLTPVIYPVEIIPEQYRAIYFLNPVAGVVDGFRKTILEGSAPNNLWTITSAVVAALLLFIGYRVFKSLEPEFADVI